MIFKLKFKGLKDVWHCIFPGNDIWKMFGENKEMIIEMLKTSQNRRRTK